jgi:hypothetical protein
MTPIRIDSFASLLEHGHGLDCWCSGCIQWAACDLEMSDETRVIMPH